MDYYNLYLKQKSGKDKDCSFLFKCDEDPSGKVIHAHKLMLLTASPYFEVNFKEEWKRNEPILITTVEHFVFEKLIHAIYLGKISFETLDEASALYEAAQFYLMEKVLDLLRIEIPKYCSKTQPTVVSRLFNAIWKHQDFKLIHFTMGYFVNNTNILIKNADFYNFSPQLVNYFYQFDKLKAEEIELHNALEKYVNNNESISVKEIKAAISSIRFCTLKQDIIENTSLLDELEKQNLLQKTNLLAQKYEGRYAHPYHFTF